MAQRRACNNNLTNLLVVVAVCVVGLGPTIASRPTTVVCVCGSLLKSGTGRGLTKTRDGRDPPTSGFEQTKACSPSCAVGLDCGEYSALVMDDGAVPGPSNKVLALLTSLGIIMELFAFLYYYLLALLVLNFF